MNGAPSDGSCAGDRVDITKPFKDFFEKRGCRIDVDETYRDRYNIDFGVSRVEGVHAAINLGIHVTLESDNYGQQEVLLEAARKGVVSKSVYVELCANSLDAGCVPIAYAACLSFIFDRRYQHAKTVGLRIFEDSSFHFFDLEENVRRLRKDLHDAAHDITTKLRGTIIAYFADKGFGFIEEAEAQKFFFHIANVVDEKLRLRLPAYVQGESIPVYFAYGGSEGKKYPKAVDVVVLEDEDVEAVED